MSPRSIRTIMISIFILLSYLLTSCNALYTSSMLFIKPGKNKAIGFADTLDYNHVESWFAHPNKLEDAVDGDFLAVKDQQEFAKAAVFYIHPTSYFSSKSWNQAVEKATSNGFLENIVMPNQAVVFIESCQVYAPKYPQATLAAFLSKDSKANAALSAATAHLEKAFLSFLRQIDGKPFILAGHSQGSYHVVALLQRLVIGTPYENRLIVALAPGYLFPTDYLEERGIVLCKSKDQMACLEVWNVLKYKSDFPNRIKRGPLPDTKRRLHKHDRLAVTNPLTLNALQSSPEENLGAYLGGFESPETPFVMGKFGAEVDTVRGVIRIKKPEDKRFRKFLMGPGWYHQYEYALYFKNIQNRINQKCKNYFND